MKTIIALLAIAASLQLPAQTPNWIWAKNAGGNSNDGGYGIDTDAAGNVYVVGNFSSTTIVFGSTTLVNAGTNTNDIFLAKYNAAGDVLWARGFGGAGIDIGSAVAIDANNQVCISGHFTSPSVIFGSVTLQVEGIRSHYVAKFDADGNGLWAKKSTVTGLLGNTIKTDLDGNIYVGGNFGDSAVSFDGVTLTNSTPLGSSLYLAKYDAAGNVLWAKNAGGTDSTNSAQCSDIETDSQNNVYITGHFEGANMSFGPIKLSSHTPDLVDIFVAKYDAAGNELWALNAGGDMNDIGRGMAIDKSGNVWVTGWFEGTASFGDIDIVSAGGYESYLAKFSPNGKALWARSLGGSLNDYGTGLCTATNGSITLAGSFRSPSISFDGTTFINKTAGKLDSYLANFDTSGQLLWVKGTGGVGDDGYYSVAGDANDNLYTTGVFSSDTLMMDADTLFNKSSGALNDIFIAKITHPDNTVPLAFTQLWAQRRQNGAWVQWQVANEQAPGTYTVQKSTNGVAFTDAHKQPATSGSSAAKAYQWLDVQATDAAVFYRIKSSDRNNRAKYSGVVCVAAMEGTATIAIYPNPVINKTVMLQIAHAKEGKYSIRIVNKAGQTMAVKEVACAAGPAHLSLPIPSLKAGDMYMLQVWAQGAVIKTLPFILE